MSVNTPFRFFGPGRAYQWADEAMSRPNVKSPSDLLMKAMVETPRSASGITRDDILDTASSIVCAVNDVHPPVARLAFKVIHGQADEWRDAELVSQLASAVASTEGVDYSKLSRLCRVAILRFRAEEQRGRSIPDAWFAHALGIRPQSLKSWRGVIDRILAQLHDWLSQAKIHAWTALHERGLIVSG